LEIRFEEGVAIENLEKLLSDKFLSKLAIQLEKYLIFYHVFIEISNRLHDFIIPQD
jgi:hypothetical protein